MIRCWLQCAWSSGDSFCDLMVAGEFRLILSLVGARVQAVRRLLAQRLNGIFVLASSHAEEFWLLTVKVRLLIPATALFWWYSPLSIGSDTLISILMSEPGVRSFSTFALVSTALRCPKKSCRHLNRFTAFATSTCGRFGSRSPPAWASPLRQAHPITSTQNKCAPALLCV